MRAQAGSIELWTSTLTIAEVIRPKRRYETVNLPEWSAALKTTDKDGILPYPSALSELERIWDYYHRHTVPSQQLPPAVIKEVKGMFAWNYLHLIQVTPAIAMQASDIARDTGLKAADAIHAASAIARKCEVLQRFDRHFDRVSHLIEVSEPEIIAHEPPLFALKSPDL